MVPIGQDGLAPMPSTHTDIVSEADVVIIGSGYTGMHAAIVTAKQGKLHKCLRHRRPDGDAAHGMAGKLVAV